MQVRSLMMNKILLFTLLLIFTCCKTQTKIVEVPQIHTEYITKTDVVRDSIYIYDKEYSRNDTVFIEKYKYKTIDRFLTDTIMNTDTITVVKEVEVPVKYVPERYKRVYYLFWGLLTALLLVVGYKIRKIIK